MLSLPVAFRPEAQRDLTEILRYLTQVSGSRSVAEAFIRRIKERCDRIGHAPNGGRLRSDLADGIRVVPFERSAVIAYTVSTERVDITNIFYGGRDYEALYRSDED